MDNIYRHYKGEYYEVLFVGEHTETHEMHVVYQRVVDPENYPWIRPYEMFHGKVLVHGREVPRFRKVYLPLKPE